MKKIGLVGAGTMGKPIGANLLKAGNSLFVIKHHNQAPIDELVSQGAKEVKDYRQLANEADIIILDLPSSLQVEQVVYPPGNLIASLLPGKIVIDMGTSNPSSTIKIAEDLANNNIDMLDAPVSGGEAGAIKGTLSIMVGGQQMVFDKMLPLLQQIGSTIVYIGGPGMGHTMKLLNNMVGVGNLVLLAEVFSVAEVLGVELETARKVMTGGSANSAALNFWGERLARKEYLTPTYRFALAAKDMRLAQNMAANAKVPYPVFSAIHQIVTIADALGLEHEDVCGLKIFWDNLIHKK